jgi:mono/diheme cytochrome c family protein
MSKPIEKAAWNIASIDATRAGSIKALYPPHGGIMSSCVARWTSSAATIAAVLTAIWSPWASAQEAAAQQPARDPYQKSLQVYEFRKAAASGPERGQEIFYYKCWFCHNEFTKDIPRLPGLYQRPALISGEPVNDDTVKAKIRDGGPGMAAYKYALSEPDLNDLVSYLREKCCWNSDSPPPNPHYRAR